MEYSTNNKWINELDHVEGELLRCIAPSEQEPIRNRSKMIKSKYQVTFDCYIIHLNIGKINRINLHRLQECLNTVPAYVTRVDFKLNEMTFNQCMNEAEKELNVEQQMLSRNENVNSILRRNIVSRNANFSVIFFLI